jgi:hypothetical protein
VAPFDAAACFLAIGMAIIMSSWSENYGDPSENKDLLAQFRGAAVAIASGRVLVALHDAFIVPCGVWQASFIQFVSSLLSTSLPHFFPYSFFLLSSELC